MLPRGRSGAVRLSPGFCGWLRRIHGDVLRALVSPRQAARGGPPGFHPLLELRELTGHAAGVDGQQDRHAVPRPLRRRDAVVQPLRQRVCLRSYTRFPSGEPNSAGVKIAARADRQARRMPEPARSSPPSPWNSKSRGFRSSALMCSRRILVSDGCPGTTRVSSAARPFSPRSSWMAPVSVQFADLWLSHVEQQLAPLIRSVHVGQLNVLDTHRHRFLGTRAGVVEQGETRADGGHRGFGRVPTPATGPPDRYSGRVPCGPLPLSPEEPPAP